MINAKKAKKLRKLLNVVTHPEQHIEDPNIPANASAIVISEVDGAFTAAVFHGREVKQNSTSYQIVEQLLSAVVGISQNATLVEDTTSLVQEG